jgi:hypothetical protein
MRNAALRSFAAILFAALPAAAQTPRQYDARVFENEWLRVHLVALNTIGHYRTEPGAPQVLYCLGALRVAADDEARGDCPAGTALFVDADDRLELRAASDPRPELLVAELKQRPSGDYVARTDAADRAAAGAYRLLVDNDAVRVMSITLPPHQRTPPHWLAGRDFLYPLASSAVRVIPAAGPPQTLQWQARAPRWTAGESRYALENAGATTAVALLVEVK